MLIILVSLFGVYNECVLVAESEQNLKSADVYKAVLDLALKYCPPLMQM